MITSLDPPSEEGFIHCLVAVDCFSKWTEIIPLKSKESAEIADWMVREFVPRFGKPRWIRVDGGREFLGTVATVCT